MLAGAYLPETVNKDLTSPAEGHWIVPKSSTEAWITGNCLQESPSEAASVEVWNSRPAAAPYDGCLFLLQDLD